VAIAQEGGEKGDAAKRIEELEKKLQDIEKHQAQMERGIKQLLIYGGDFSKHSVKLGLTAGPLAEQTRKALGLREGQGIVVKRVDSGPKEAGVKEDDVVIAVNGEPCRYDSSSQIWPDPKQQRMLPGDTITLTVIRGGKKQDIPVNLWCANCGAPGSCLLSSSCSIVPKKAKKVGKGKRATKAEIAACQANLRQIHTSCMIYEIDNKLFPFAGENAKAHEHLQLLVDAGVIEGPKLFVSPASGTEKPALVDKDGHFKLSENTCSYAYTNQPRNSTSRGLKRLVANKRLVDKQGEKGLSVLYVNGNVEWVKANGNTWEELTKGQLTK
jgi:hypothetical protein